MKFLKRSIICLAQDVVNGLIRYNQFIILIFGHFVFTLLLLNKGLVQYDSSFEIIPYFLIGITQTSLLFLVIDFICFQFLKTKLRFSFQILFFIFYFLLQIFYFISGAQLDFPLLVYNFYEIFTWEAIVSIFGFLPFWSYLLFLFVLISSILSVYKFDKIEFYKYRSHFQIFFLVPIIYLLSIIFNFKTICPYSFFIHSTLQNSIEHFDSTLNESLVGQIKIQQLENSIYIKNPNVFFILVESLSFEFLGLKNSQGYEITPFLNSLSKENLLFD